MQKRVSSKRIEWKSAPDVKRRVLHLIKSLEINWLKPASIYCFRSHNANTRAYARIWGLSRIWQQALKTKPAYVLEIISEKYDDLNEFEQDKILLHEITHIPRNFSGSLMPHIRHGKRSFHKKVDLLISQYLNVKRKA